MTQPLAFEVEVLGPVDISIEAIFKALQEGSRVGPYTSAQHWEYAQSCVKWSKIFGARLSGCVAQMFHETGFLWTRSPPNQVDPKQFNFGGVGATNDGASGVSAQTIDMGVLIYFCHWALYVFGHPDGWPEHLRQYRQYALRLDAVSWSHHHVQKLDGSLLGFLASIRVYGDWVNCRWAKSDGYPCGSPLNLYRNRIVDIGNYLLDIEAQLSDDEGEEDDMYAEIFGDLVTKSWVGQLEVNNGGGPWWSPFSTKEIRDFGELVVHFNGPDVGSDDIAHMLNVNIYHIWNKDWRTDPTQGTFLHQKTIAYKTMVTDKGEFHLLVPFHWGTWHCGNTPWNKLSMSVYVPIGVNQHMTDVQRATLYRVCERWLQWVGSKDRQKIKGHYQLSSTNCPGTIKQDFLIPYWDGAKFADEHSPDANSRHFTETGHWVINTDGVKMLDYFNRLGGLEFCGLPLDGMIQRPDGVYEQWFENCLLEFWPGGFGHFSEPHYRLGGAGQRYFQVLNTVL